MTQKQSQNVRSNGSTVTQPPHPEVVPQAQRRIFTARYKLWVLEEADKCRDQPGQIGALLRREGQVAQAELIIEAQKKLSEILGLTLNQERGKPR